MSHRTTAFVETVPLVLLLLLLLSATFSQSISARLDVITAECSPKEPLFASGSTMELNCTLRNATPGVSVHQVHCTFAKTNLTVVVLDDNTFQMRRENITREMSHGHMFCYLNVLGKPEQIAQVVIRVADIPVAPRITGCVVYNWESMVCTWNDPKQDTGLPTNYTLGWTRLCKVSDSYFDCPHATSNTCTWNKLDGRNSLREGPYCLRILAYNQLTTVYSLHIIGDNNDIVKPNPVDNLHSTNTTSQSVDLTWTWGKDIHEDRSRTLLYRVNYTSEWDSKSVNTTSSNTILSSLVPHTEYTISVECIPLKNNTGKGFWSNATVTYLFTKEDVPGQAPALADGSYSTGRDSAGKYVVVYWQLVPKRWLHGTLKQFRIRCFNYWNRSHVLAEKFEHGSHSQLSVSDGQDLVVTVEAETTMGYNDSLDLKTLVIPRAGRAPAVPGIVHAVRNQSEITAMWTSVSNASGYTVYWCKKTGFGQCEVSYNWTSVSPDVTSWTISIGSVRHDDFHIAVSVEMYVAALEQTVSSGMMLARCIPDIDKSVKPPSFVTFAKDQQAFSLTVEWLIPKCEKTAYIVKFEILYCQRRSCNDAASCCNNKTMFVENNETKAVITDLEADVEYEVSMRSISFMTNSTYTAPIQHTVVRSGLTAGVIAAIVIAALVLLLLLVVGLLTVAKKIKKCLHCCEKITIKPPPSIRIQTEPAENDQIRFSRDGYDEQTQIEEQKSLLHDGIATKQETDPEMGTVIIGKNGQDYRYPNLSKSFQPPVSDNGIRLPGRNQLTDSGVPQSHDSSISSYTHLAVHDEGVHKEPNSFVEIGRVANPSSDHTSHILPLIAADSPPSQTLDAVEPPDNAVTNVTEPYMPVEKIPLPINSSSSSAITPYTTVEQTFEMAEPKIFAESGGHLPADAKGDAMRQVETPAVDCHNTKLDDYQQVQCPVDDYISGCLAGSSNVLGEPPINNVNNAELMAEGQPLYTNHRTPSEDGYSDQRDIAVGTSSQKPLLPVGYIPLAPTLST